MANKKNLTRTIAAVMSFALAFGAAGNFPIKTPKPMLNASASEDDYVGLVELQLDDVYITDVSPDKRYIEFVQKSENGSYDISYYNKMRLEIYFDYYYDEDYNEVTKTAMEKQKEKEFLRQLEEGDVATIKFTVWKQEIKDGNFDDFLREERLINAYTITAVKKGGIHLYGDINDDGVVDSFDVLSYRKYIAGTMKNKLTKDMFLNADINQDEVIDEDDLRQVIDFTLGKKSEFNSSEIGSIRLDNTVEVLASEGTSTDDKFAAAEMNFGVEMLKKSYDPSANLLLSPVSVSTALAMTANGADNETRKEMESVLGGDLTINQLNSYLAYYADHLPNTKDEKVYMANSIWFKNIEKLKILNSFLETNKKFYNAEIYKTDFSESTVKDVNSWVSKNTRGMIPTLVSKKDLDPKLMMMLINTLYFEADWNVPYDNSYKTSFTDIKGNEHTVDMMSHEEYKYYDLGNAQAFKKPYKGNYSFVGILPNEDVDFNEYIESLDAAKLSEGLKVSEDPSTFELRVSIPKFKYSYSKSLKEVLKDMGMQKAFDKLNADFSKMNDLTVPNAEPLYIDDVLHKTKIELTEKGTRAAAVAAVMMWPASAMPTKKVINIRLNRPFVYMIVDENNVPAFIGAVTSLDAE